MVRAEYLRCEYLVDPVGVDAEVPRFSWKPMAGDPKAVGVTQTGYRILVASSPSLLAPTKADYWDSGVVASRDSFGIEYGGKGIPGGRTAYWKVQLTDGHQAKSRWSKTAEWTAGPEWRAQWIQHPVALADDSHVEANNGFHGSEVDRDDDVQWVQIDLGSAQPIDEIRLFPARPFDFADTPGFLFPVRFKLSVSDDPEFGSSTDWVDHSGKDFPNPGTKAVEFTGKGKGRYVRLTVSKLHRRDAKVFSYALAEMEVISRGHNVALHKPVTANKSTEIGEWSKVNLVDGDTVSHGPLPLSPLPANMLRREFTLSAIPVRVNLFASGLGVYEITLNGKRVGDHILAPEWTDYRDRVQYQGYDVTKMLKAGVNVIGVTLGDGWYAGRVGWYPRAMWGRVPAFLCQMEAEGVPLLVTDSSWQSTDDGPIRVSDMMDGEAYDARNEMPGWDQPGFAAQSWKTVRVLGPGFSAGSNGSIGQTRLSGASSPVLNPAIEHGDTDVLGQQRASGVNQLTIQLPPLVAQPNEAIKIHARLKPLAITEPQKGVYVIDLGQNMVGWARVRFQGKAGQTARMRFAEVLSDDGMVYTANLRSAAQTDTYTFANDQAVIFEPHFTYHGFRYIEITGVSAKPQLSDITGMVFNSTSPEVGRFSCSSPMLNRLWENILWTQRANLMSSPTDCPQRNERLGWMGDIQAFGQTAIFNMDMDGFFAKWTQDQRDSQSSNGLFPEYAPWPPKKDTALGSPAWSDAGVFVPWTAYQNYGDLALLRNHYSSAKRYVDYLHVNNPDGLWLHLRGHDFNDWLNGDTLIQKGWPTTGGAVPNEVLASAFMARSTEVVKEMADALGEKSDSEHYRLLAEKSRDAFCRAYVDADGRIKGDTQAGYALALSFNLLPVNIRPMAVNHMVDAISKYGDHISTGIQTTHRLMLELTRWGYNDLAYKLMLNRTFPSWGYSIDNGATSIWERWDGYVKGRGFQNPNMNSFNHWALGAVGEWMMKVIGGIWPGDLPGWAHPVIHPMPGGGLTSAEASYDSVRGKISVRWSISRVGFDIAFSVPAKTTATVIVPGGNRKSGEQIVQGHPGLRFIDLQSKGLVFEAQSGTYSLHISN